MNKIIISGMLGVFTLSSLSLPLTSEGMSSVGLNQVMPMPILDTETPVRQWGWITLDELPGDPRVSCELPEMSQGARNNSVYLAQIILKNSDNYPEGLITGYFGRLTKKAVQSYQKKHGFTPNGKVDSDTRVALNEYIRANFSECKPTPIDPIQPSENVFAGTLYRALGSTYQWGTHTLVVSLGYPTMMPAKAYPVKAANDSVLGDLYKYEGAQKVTIFGRLEYQNFEGGFWGIIAEKVTTDVTSPPIPAPSPLVVTKSGTYVVKWNSYDTAGKSYFSKEPSHIATLQINAEAGSSILVFDKDFVLSGNKLVLVDYKNDVLEEVEISNFVKSMYGYAAQLKTPISKSISVEAKLISYFAAYSGKTNPNQTFDLGAYRPGDVISLSHFTRWVSNFNTTGHTIFKQVFSSDPYYYNVYKISDSHWKVFIDDGVHYDFISLGEPASYNDGEFEIYLVDQVQDNLPPVFTGVSGPSSLRVSEVGVWNVGAYDPDGNYVFYGVDWGDGEKINPENLKNNKVLSQNQNVTFSHSYQNSGRYTIVFTITDEKGAFTQRSFVVDVSKDKNTPPTITTNPIKGSIMVNERIDLMFTGFDADGDHLSWEFSFGDDRPSVWQACFDGPCNELRLIASWPKAGEYVPIVTVSDGKDKTEFAFSISVRDATQNNIPPVITGVGGPTRLKVNEVGTWSIKAHDPDGNYLEYFIDWGDNSILVPQRDEKRAWRLLDPSATFTHSYSADGRYMIKIIVRDANGGEAQSTITVWVIKNVIVFDQVPGTRVSW